MKRNKALLMYLSLFLFSLTGCLPMSHEKLSVSIGQQELSEHVDFLAHPALKGRKPKTWGSVVARKYLKTRFEAYGLVPWPGLEGYEQSFGFGTNVIGVMRGSDPELADEYVILTAHYDHLGKTKKGILPGACDNASGVAALLEIAEYFSLTENKPKRSICFASFDCEEYMLLGALMFSCKKEFEDQEIAAVVNIDMLGRDFLDVVEDSLFVAGTESYPQLQAHIDQAEQKTGLNIFQLASRMIGPRGDHIVFENMEVPVLFFCCGLNKDYHKTGDTADKLDYTAMQKSAKVIAETVDMFARTEQIEEPTVVQTGNKNELRDLMFVLDKINANHEALNITAEHGQGLQELSEETQRLIDEEEYTMKQQKEFAWQAVETLVPVLTFSDKPSDPNDTSRTNWQTNWYLIMYELYADHSGLLIDQARKTVKQMLEDKLSLFNIPEFDCDIFLISQGGLSFTERKDGRYHLDLIVLKANKPIFKKKKSFFRPTGFHFPSLSHKITDFPGTKDQVTDYCLLEWRKKPTNEFYSQTWSCVLSEVTGHEHGPSYEDWMEWRLDILGLEDEEQWLTDLREGDNQRMAHYAGKKIKFTDHHRSNQQELREVIRDPNAAPEKRVQAIWGLRETNRESMLMLVELLDDQTQRPKQNWSPRYMNESYPLANHRAVREARKNWIKQLEKGPGTIGDAAKIMLEMLANQDPAIKDKQEESILIKVSFDKDAGAWRKWIMANVK